MYRLRPWYEQTLNHWIFDHVSIQTVGSDTHFYFGNVCLACVPASRLVRDLTCVPVSVFQEKMNQRLVPAAEQFVALRLRYVAAFTNRCLQICPNPGPPFLLRPRLIAIRQER